PADHAQVEGPPDVIEIERTCRRPLLLTKINVQALVGRSCNICLGRTDKESRSCIVNVVPVRTSRAWFVGQSDNLAVHAPDHVDFIKRSHFHELSLPYDFELISRRLMNDQGSSRTIELWLVLNVGRGYHQPMIFVAD